MNSKRLYIVVVAFSLAGLTGCDAGQLLGGLWPGDSGESYECRLVAPSEAGPVFTVDDKLANIAESVEGGFGGYYYHDDEHVLMLYMQDPENRAAAEEVRSRLASYFEKTREWKNIELRIRKGKFTAAQLNKWKDRSTNIVGLPGVNMQDLAEARNRLVFGISTEAENPESVRACIMKNADHLGIPRTAIAVEMRPPVELL